MQPQMASALLADFAELFHQLLREEEQKLYESAAVNHYAARRIAIASSILDKLVCNDTFTDFLTIPAYEYID